MKAGIPQLVSLFSGRLAPNALLEIVFELAQPLGGAGISKMAEGPCRGSPHKHRGVAGGHESAVE